MPPEPTQPRARPAGRRALVVGVAGLVAGIAVFVAIALWAGSGDVEVRLGDAVFEAGRAAALAPAIDEGGPLLFSDVAGGARDIYLNHLGDDPEGGWVAFDARPPGADRQCFLQWREEGDHFVDPCTGDVYPPNGGSLTHYPVTVDGGRVQVDLRDPSDD